ncbi:MAG: cysteine desulfurase family protein [Limnochordia bacterium]|nr:cysteine desulfurase [Bacillota bacterium]
MAIYLDNSATTKPHPQVIEAMVSLLQENYGNPSSLHAMGQQAERVITKARRDLAGALGVKEKEIIFTSGGTEANNMAIKGVVRAYGNRGRHIITSRIEHPSILEVFRELEDEGFRATYLEVDGDGRITPAKLAEALEPETILVSLFHVNNEIGSINPLPELAQVLSQRGRQRPFFHVDAVQSFGKLPVRPARWGIDLLSLSGHKIHGPKGVGALYLREGLAIPPLILGGGQERGLRSGTENVAGIGGFGLAALLAEEEREGALPKVAELRKAFLERLKGSGCRVNSPDNGSPYILNLSFPGFRGEVLVHALAEKGVYVSTGSACSSRARKQSHVLESLGLSPAEVAGAIRVSFSRRNSLEEAKKAGEILAHVAAELGEFMG